jgi:hypothetical protein
MIDSETCRECGETDKAIASITTPFDYMLGYVSDEKEGVGGIACASR